MAKIDVELESFRSPIGEKLRDASIEDRYRMTRPIVPLGESRYAPISKLKKLPVK